MNFLSILGLIILLILVLIMVFLIIGFRISIKSYKTDTKFKLTFIIKFLFIKLFSKEYNSFKELYKRKDKDSKEESDEKNEGGDFNLKKIKELWSLIKENKNPILTFLKTVFNSIKIKKCDFDLYIGLSSPVDTVLTASYISCFFNVANVFIPIKVSAEPVLSHEALDYDFNTEIEITLLKPLLGFFRLILRKSMIKLIKEARSA